MNFPKKRRVEISLCRLRIGHTKLTHGHLMVGMQANHCDVCDVPISVEHLICTCPQYTAPRIRYFGRDQPNIVDILGKKAPTDKIIDFLKDTRLLNLL